MKMDHWYCAISGYINTRSYVLIDYHWVGVMSCHVYMFKIQVNESTIIIADSLLYRILSTSLTHFRQSQFRFYILWNYDQLIDQSNTRYLILLTWSDLWQVWLDHGENLYQKLNFDRTSPHTYFYFIQFMLLV